MALNAVKIYRGDSWGREWRLTDENGAPIDLTGASARLQARDAAGILAIEASTVDGRLVLGGVAGTAAMTVPYSATAIAPGSYRFDFEITYAGGSRRTYEQNVLVVLEDMARDT